MNALPFVLALLAPAEEPAQPSNTATPDSAPVVEDAGERDSLEHLRSIEARLSTGAALTDAERDAPVKALASDPSPHVRALAAAVLAWIDPTTSAPALTRALKDKDDGVRTTAAQSLLSLSRRLGEDAKKDVLVQALGVLDDPSDEVACAAAELVQALSPSAAVDAVRARADGVKDVRYACFSRIAGLPPRAVEVPTLPPSEAPPTNDVPEHPESPPTVVPAAPPELPPDGSWLLVSVAVASGGLAGALIPGGFFPSHDVLTYTPDRTRVTHEEVSFFAQAGAALVGGALAGGAAYGVTRAFPVTMDGAVSAALLAGSATLMGGSAQLALGLQDQAAVFTLSGATVAGIAAGTALALFSTPTPEDHALALSLGAGGAFLGALAVFTVTPVGYDKIGDAFRTEFGFGIAGLSAGALTIGGLAAGLFVDVPISRSVGALGGGLLLGSFAAGAAFLVTPRSLDIKSRVACGVGLGGALIGAAAGAILVPDAWFQDVAPGTALSLDLSSGATRLARVGIPMLMPVDVGASQGLAMTLVNARF